MRGFASLAFAFSLVAGMAGVSHAQAVVPGGWGTRVGYQSISGVASGGYYGPVYGGYGSYGGYGNGVASPSYGVYAATPLPYPTVAYPPQARTVNGLVPLGQVIQRSTRARRR